jgi:dihydrofolate reductase
MMANSDSRVTIHMAASLDGFIARKDGRVDWLETSDEFAGGDTLDPGFVETFLKTIDCYVMGSRTYETALSFEAKGLGWSYGDKPTFVLTSRDLPRIRDTVQFYSGDLAQFVNGHLRPTFRTIWFVGGGAVSGECLRLGLADEVRYSILPILIGDGIPFFEKLDRDISIWRRSKPIRAAWWSFVTRYEDIVASHGTPPPNQALQPTARTALFFQCTA